jgi:hypothetical protein
MASNATGTSIDIRQTYRLTDRQTDRQTDSRKYMYVVHKKLAQIFLVYSIFWDKIFQSRIRFRRNCEMLD